MNVSVRQLSAMLGYSTATISNALNYKKNVNKETADKIRQAAAKHGYKTSRQINQIRFISYRSSGMVVADTPFFASLISGVESESKLLNFPLTITILDSNSSSFKQELDGIINDPNSGNILLATEMTEKDLSLFDDIQGPLVVLDAWFASKKKNTVQINNRDSVEEAITYLLEMGHTNIGYLRSSIDIQNFKERYTGYAQALMKCGIDHKKQPCYSITPSLIESYNDMLAILENNKDMPTAFFADNDNIAVGCMRALQENGYKIPQDVSMVGFDDMPFAEICSPPLTTIKVSKEDLGRFAVKRIKDMHSNEDSSSMQSLLSCELIKRGSVYRIKQKG